jgi:hypothetical protein
VEKLQVCDPAVFEGYKFGYNNITLYSDPERNAELSGIKMPAGDFFMQS